MGPDGEEIRLPYEFTGVKVYGTGVDAARVQASLGADGTARITLTDASGSALMDIEALATRQADAAQLASLARSAHRTPLLTCEWGEVAQDAEPSTTVRNAVIGEVVPGLPDGTPVHPDLDALTAAVTDGAPIPDHAILHLPPTTGDPVEATHTLTATTLTTLQQWLADDRFTHTHLTVLTHHATTPTPDLAHAAIWGLTRSAQTEHPDRITLLDTDTTTTTAATAAAGLHPIPDPTTLTRHPQLAWHNNTLTTPRLTPTTSTNTRTGTSTSTGIEPQPNTFDPNGTVLITGGTGTLGALLARHLVTHHHVRHLHLTSRRGPNAPGATQLHNDLTTLGATVTITATDTTNPHTLKTLLTTLTTNPHPLTAIIHTAGTLNDALLTHQTPHHLTHTLTPKADTAHHLHHLTNQLKTPLTHFILYS
ncbi:KR domain-containing protein, partial [Streptomyces solisilvae]|uniref:KR domain-containing protein n=1 Tax=Streptomyces malaysiensis TaxID=92644 RepID=UPI00367B042C